MFLMSLNNPLALSFGIYILKQQKQNMNKILSFFQEGQKPDPSFIHKERIQGKPYTTKEDTSKNTLTSFNIEKPRIRWSQC